MKGVESLREQSFVAFGNPEKSRIGITLGLLMRYIGTIEGPCEESGRFDILAMSFTRIFFRSLLLTIDPPFSDDSSSRHNEERSTRLWSKIAT